MDPRLNLHGDLRSILKVHGLRGVHLYGLDPAKIRSRRSHDLLMAAPPWRWDAWMQNDGRFSKFERLRTRVMRSFGDKCQGV